MIPRFHGTLACTPLANSLNTQLRTYRLNAQFGLDRFECTGLVYNLVFTSMNVQLCLYSSFHNYLSFSRDLLLSGAFIGAVLSVRYRNFIQLGVHHFINKTKRGVFLLVFLTNLLYNTRDVLFYTLCLNQQKVKL